MGMYNEVVKQCPHCDGYGVAQIHQIVLGFGNFNLDDPRSLDELTDDQLEELYEAVKDEWFACVNKQCDRSFKLCQIAPTQRRLGLLAKLAGKEEEDGGQEV